MCLKDFGLVFTLIFLARDAGYQPIICRNVLWFKGCIQMTGPPKLSRKILNGTQFLWNSAFYSLYNGNNAQRVHIQQKAKRHHRLQCCLQGTNPMDLIEIYL